MEKRKKKKKSKEKRKRKSPTKNEYRLKAQPSAALTKGYQCRKVGKRDLCDSSLLWLLFVSAQRREQPACTCIMLPNKELVGRREGHITELQSRGLVRGGKGLLNAKVSSAFS